MRVGLTNINRVPMNHSTHARTRFVQHMMGHSHQSPTHDTPHCDTRARVTNRIRCNESGSLVPIANMIYSLRLVGPNALRLSVPCAFFSSFLGPIAFRILDITKAVGSCYHRSAAADGDRMSSERWASDTPSPSNEDEETHKAEQPTNKEGNSRSKR